MWQESTGTMSDSESNTKTLTNLSVFYLILLLYACLMPYDFSTNIDLQWEIKRALHSWPVNPHGHVSGSDVLSNLLLYIPLGALLTTRWRLKNKNRLLTFVTAVCCCSITSFFVESTQLFSIFRTSSITDFIMNTISGILGSFIGVLWGVSMWQRLVASLQYRKKHAPADLLTLLFAALLAADALAPFLPSILLKDVWRSVKAANFNPVAGFYFHPWHEWLVTHILVYVVFTLLAAQWEKSTTRLGLLKAALFCALFSLMLEGGKLFIASRTMNASNLVANYAGIFIAIILTWWWRRPLPRRLKLNLGIAGLVFYLLYLGWFPFNFTYNSEMIRAKFPHGVEFLPLYHYVMGASLNHLRLFIQSVVLSMTLIYLLRLRLWKADNLTLSLPLVLLLSGALGILQEGGQLFLPSRTPSMTDIYCYMLGGVLATRIPLLIEHTSPIKEEI